MFGAAVDLSDYSADGVNTSAISRADIVRLNRG